MYCLSASDRFILHHFIMIKQHSLQTHTLCRAQVMRPYGLLTMLARLSEDGQWPSLHFRFVTTGNTAIIIYLLFFIQYSLIPFCVHHISSPKLIERAVLTLFMERRSSSPILSFRRRLSRVRICSRRTMLSLASPHFSACTSI